MKHYTLASSLLELLKEAKRLAKKYEIYFELECDPRGEWTAEFCNPTSQIIYEGISKRQPDTAIKRAIKNLINNKSRKPF